MELYLAHLTFYKVLLYIAPEDAPTRMMGYRKFGKAQGWQPGTEMNDSPPADVWEMHVLIWIASGAME